MKDYSRYAIYYAPPPGEFADFCAAWLGWNATERTEVAPPEVPGLPCSVAEITKVPRKYGFHGTLKPPFRLAQGKSAEALKADFEALAARTKAFALDGLSLSRLGGFLALIPEGDSAAMADLAALCVQEFDSFRAPPGEAELARRRSVGLSETQEALLARWGYPYVLEEFRFHLTLSSKLPEAVAKQAHAALEPVITPLLPRPFAVQEICLFGEAADGRFHLLNRAALSG